MATDGIYATPMPGLDTVAGLEAQIRGSIPAMEARRALPDDLRQSLQEAGLFHFLLPEDVGGAGATLPAALRLLESLAQIDASTAWCVAIGAGTSVLGSMMDPEAARESVWSQPLGISVGTLGPFGRAVPNGDSYHVVGRWPFCSACVGASWYIAFCGVFEGDSPKLDAEGNRVVVMLPVPMRECRIDETWDSPGLRGTGSHHVAVDGASVPVAHGFQLLDTARPNTPLHEFPVMAFLDTFLAAIMTGVVKGALDDLFEIFGARAGEKGGLDNLPESVALEVADVMAESRAWRALLFDSVDELWRATLAARTSGEPVADDGIDVRLAAKAGSRRGPALVSAITLLAGGRSLIEAPALHRRLRDAHAIASHIQYSTPVAASLAKASVLKYAASRQNPAS